MLRGVIKISLHHFYNSRERLYHAGYKNKKKLLKSVSGCSQSCNTNLAFTWNRLGSPLHRRCSTFCLDFFICLQCQLKSTTDCLNLFFIERRKKLTEAWIQQRSHAKTSTVLHLHNLTWNLRFLLWCFSLFWAKFEKPSGLCKTIVITSNTFAIWWLPARLVSSAPRTRGLEEHTQTLH